MQHAFPRATSTEPRANESGNGFLRETSLWKYQILTRLDLFVSTAWRNRRWPRSQTARNNLSDLPCDRRHLGIPLLAFKACQRSTPRWPDLELREPRDLLPATMVDQNREEMKPFLGAPLQKTRNLLTTDELGSQKICRDQKDGRLSFIDGLLDSREPLAADGDTPILPDFEQPLPCGDSEMSNEPVQPGLIPVAVADEDSWCGHLSEGL